MLFCLGLLDGGGSINRGAAWGWWAWAYGGHWF